MSPVEGTHIPDVLKDVVAMTLRHYVFEASCKQEKTCFAGDLTYEGS